MFKMRSRIINLQSYRCIVRCLFISSKASALSSNSPICMEVPTFCDLNVDLPCNISMKHLDLHLYDANKVVINMKECGIQILHALDGNVVHVKGEGPKDKRITCEIVAPIKANLNITSTGGSIDVGRFDSDHIRLKTIEGNVFLEQYFGETVKIDTENGDVKLGKAVQAKHISVHISESGSISTGRLQGVELSLSTRKGDISVASSYCDKSEFVVEEGNLLLSNAHKDCKLNVQESGSIKMTGFDGKLQAYIKHGPVDIQVSRVLDDSSLHVEQGGDLTLRLSEECQQDTSFKISANKVHVEESVGLIKSLAKHVAYLTALNELCKNFRVRCRNSNVEVKSASWADMLFAQKDKHS